MLLKIGQVAEMLGISNSQVYQLTYKGELPIFQRKKGCAVRIKSEDVDKYLESIYRTRPN